MEHETAGMLEVVGSEGAYLVAIPEQRANAFRATRSPNRILRMGPRTVAQCATGSRGRPSPICHSTLDVRHIARR